MTSSSSSPHNNLNYTKGVKFLQHSHIYDLPTDFVCSDFSQPIVADASANLERNRPYCRALYDFRSELPNELEFSTGDLIFFEKRINSEWLAGECQSNGRKGIFPQTFVDIVVPLQGEETTIASDLSAQFSATGVSDQIGVASALYDFEPRFADELPLRAGESVQMLELIGTEWAKCRDPTSGLAGIVPQCFLHIFLDTTATGPTQSVLDSSPSVGNNEQLQNVISKPWDVPLFQPSTGDFSFGRQQSQSAPFSTCSSVFDSDSIQWSDSTGTSMAQRPPPRPPPPKFSNEPKSTNSVFSESPSENASSLSWRKTKTNSSKRRSHNQQHNVELVEEADESLVIHAGREIRGGQPDSVNPNLVVPNATMATAATQLDSKQKVVLDLLNTERTYLYDLNSWETSIQESADLSSEDKKALTNGYAPLKQLSHTLITQIVAQKDLPAADQHFGQTFMELKDRFFAAHAYHFRYVEQIGVLVENDEDAPLQEALQKCLLAMRQRGSNVFDVPSAVSRPIQRCLKYPLYVGELLKNTPIHHPDHPKLMESLRQFGTLASRMNECKRRKELIRKYRTEQQLSLADRLSRINIHSLVKKSNRLKYRFNRSIGLNTARYTEFDYLVQLLEEAERRLCKFLYCAQLYKKHIEQCVKRYEDSYKGVCQAQDENVVKMFGAMFRRLDELCRRHLQAFDQQVITEGKKLVRSDLAKLVHKRFDKLADYETAKVTHKNSEEVEMRRAEFEALNNQIKAQLPRVIGTINTRVLELIQRVNEHDAEFLRRMDQWFANERPERMRDCFSAALPFRAHLSASHRHTLAELNKIAALLSSGTNAIHRRKSLRLSLRGPKANHRHNAVDGHPKQHQKMQKRRAQTMKERDALMKICHAQKQTQRLHRVLCDWENAEMTLKQGDTVMVEAHRQDGFSVCDNAVTVGLVPVVLLAPFDNSFAASFSAASPSNDHTIVLSEESADQMEQKPTDSSKLPFLLFDFTTPNGANNSQNADKTNLNEIMPNSVKFGQISDGDVDLIELEDNLIDLDSPPKIDMKPRELKPISSCIGDQSKHLLLENCGQEEDWSSSSSPLPALPMPPIPDRPLSSLQQNPPSLPMPISLMDLSASSSSIKPIRTAPLPPSTNRQGEPTTHCQAVPVEQVEEQQRRLFMSDQMYRSQNSLQFTMSSSHSFAVCIFDFAPAHDNNARLESHQLTIMKGDVVEILRRHDDGGNTEWCLVRKTGQQHGTGHLQQLGGEGYVPANYLSYLNNQTV